MRNIVRQQGTRDQINLTYKEIGNIFNIISDAITIHDKDFNIIHANSAALDLLGTNPNRLLRQKCYKSYHGTGSPPEGCPSCLVLRTGKPATSEVYEPNLKKHIEIRAFPRFDSENRAIGIVHIVRDISKRMQTEEKLKETVRKLENTVQELKVRTEDLQESNSAFKFILKQRELDKRELEESILANIKHIILPTIKRLTRNRSIADDGRKLKLLESNLMEIISPFSRTLSTRYGKLAPREIEVARLLRDGIHDKEISEDLGISLDTVKAHRRNIRKKLDLYGKRTNLRTFLQSLPN